MSRVVRTLFLAAVLLLASAGVAQATDVTIVSRAVPLHGGRSLAAAPPARFDMVGLHWQGTGTPLFRTQSLSGRWSGWTAADDDWGRDGSGWRKGNAEWTGPARAIQYRLQGRVTALRAYFLWSPIEAIPSRRLSIAGSPVIIPRESWGADERIRRDKVPRYAPALRFALIHHTVTTNDYTPAESAAIVRGIYVYHVKGNGWDDIGYNFLVDKYGQVFEGRYGGVDKPVVGAHAEGFNTGSVGIALLGSYNTVGISAAARASLVKLLAWRLDVAHVDPLSFLNAISRGNSKFPAGIPVNLRAISGHRDVYFTECPGNALYAEIPSIAQSVAATGGPKLYAPLVQGKVGSLLRFTGKLSKAMPWQVTIADHSGANVASGRGTGTAIDWTYDSTRTPPGRYSWTMGAGASVRPATGGFTVNGVPPPPMLLTALTVSPSTISPNGDNVNDQATVSYTLGSVAAVSATLVNSVGVATATLFNQVLPPGPQSFAFSGSGIADGPYTIAVTATAAEGAPVTLSAPVTIDRTLASFAVTPAFSPAGNAPTRALEATFQLFYPANATFEILGADGKVLATPFTGPLDAGVAQTLTWNGTLPDGSTLPDGTYKAALVLAEPTGPVTHTLPFVADSTAPNLTLVSARSLEFRVNEPGTVTLTVRGTPWRRYVKTVAQPGLVSFWISSPQPDRFTAKATDAVGNTSTVVLHL